MFGHSQMLSIVKSLWPSCEYRQDFNNDREEIDDIIEPIIVTATLFGLIPIAVNFSRIKQIFVPVPKSIYLNSFRFLIVASLNILFFSFQVYLLYFSAGSANFSNLPKRLNYLFENLNNLIVCLTAYINGYLNHKKYLEILNRLIYAWTKLPPTETGRKSLKKIYVQSYVIVIGIAVILLLFIYFNSEQDSKAWRLVIGMSMNMPQTIQIVFHGLYTILVILLAAVLGRVTDNCKPLPQSASVIQVRPKQAYLTLLEMRLLYIEVYEIKLSITRAFRAPLIYSLLQTFHALIAESYFIYYGIFYSKDIPTFLIYACAVWVMCQIIKIYSLSYSGNLLKNEASRFAETLLALPTEGQDIRWFLEVQNLSTLMKYMSMDIDLYGFMSLDATLLFNALASALTCLIYLAQFAE